VGYTMLSLWLLAQPLTEEKNSATSGAPQHAVQVTWDSAGSAAS